MGQPNMSNVILSYDEYIVIVKEYPGTETSNYPEEKKDKISIPSVAASESGKAQTNLRVGVRDTI